MPWEYRARRSRARARARGERHARLPGPPPLSLGAPSFSLPLPPTCYSPPELHLHWPSPPAPPYPPSGWSVSREGRGRRRRDPDPGSPAGWLAALDRPLPGPWTGSRPPEHLLASAAEQCPACRVLGRNLRPDSLLPFPYLRIKQNTLRSHPAEDTFPAPRRQQPLHFSSVSLFPNLSRIPILDSPPSSPGLHKHSAWHLFLHSHLFCTLNMAPFTESEAKRAS
ncbi:uncharacterized protein LOC133074494 [Dama dama]|uniref:uncharacterized protein LOC133074494 n=1 Tax=Dama dama TaxID=30532 RepID=UPI002A36D963|nr:uncharacterized protein LOC133074494 [Dama dama]